jgi:hypothetical protein
MLDFWAVPNVEMEDLAKVVWMQHHSHSTPISCPVLDGGFQLWLPLLATLPAFLSNSSLWGRCLRPTSFGINGFLLKAKALTF